MTDNRLKIFDQSYWEVPKFWSLLTGKGKLEVPFLRSDKLPFRYAKRKRHTKKRRVS